MTMPNAEAANPSIVHWPVSEYKRVATITAANAARKDMTAMAIHKSMPMILLGNNWAVTDLMIQIMLP